MCTHPSYRGRGLASGLIGYTLRCMKEKGYNLSLPLGSWSGYERLGWVTIPGKKAIVKAEPVPTEDDYRLRKFQGEDFEDIVNIYETFNFHRTGSTIRTAEYWRKHVQRVAQAPTVLMVEEKGGKAVAYARCKAVGNSLVISEVNYMEDDPRLLENTLKGIISHAYEDNSANVAIEVLSEAHPLIEALNQTSLRVNYEEAKGVMARFVNLKSLFEKIRPEIEERIRRTPYCDWKGSVAIQCDLDGITLKIKNGTVKTDDAATADVFLPLNQKLLFKLIFRYASAMKELFQNLSLTAEELGLLESLFPKQEPIHWAKDHF